MGLPLLTQLFRLKIEIFFFVTKKWLMFIAFSWELSNIPVLRPKRPKPFPLGPHIPMINYGLYKGVPPGGQPQGGSYLGLPMILGHVIVLVWSEQRKKKWCFVMFLERFQSYLETLRRSRRWWRPSWIYTQGDQLENHTVHLSCIMRPTFHNRTSQPHSSFVLCYLSISFTL